MKNPNFRRTLLGAAAVCAVAFVAPAASAAIIVDGNLDAAYGAPTAHVSYNAAAPTSNFSAPTDESNAIAYDIYLSADANYVYGYFKTDPSEGGAQVGAFTNVYFDLDPANNNGSDLGFEIGLGNTTAFIPGVGSPVAQSNILVALSADSSALEFAIPVVDFTTQIGGLTYMAGHSLVSASDPDLTLRISQSFGYSAAGGDSYGADRLGHLTVPFSAVPEPLTLSLFGAGLAGMFAARRRKTATK